MEKLKGYLEKVKEALGKVSKKIWILIAVGVVLIAAAVIIFINSRPYSTLIAGATSEETATVLTWLEGQGVTDYRMEGQGTILVPESMATSLKARLLQEQYTSSDSPYSGYFERVNALSTVKDRDNAWLVTLTESMQETIRKFDGVRSASVNINLGEDRGYVLDTNNLVEASVGVLLTMENGKTLSPEQANAMRYFISHSVASLSVDNISITDTKGNIYDNVGGGASAADSTNLKLQTEQYWSNLIRSHVEQVLIPVYGEENVAVTATCSVELGEKTINEYDVRLPEFAQNGSTNGAGIIGKRFYNYQVVVDDEVVAGGVVGTPSNADLPTYVEEGENLIDALGRLLGEGSIEYDNPKTQTQMTITAATLTDVTVAVSINSTTAGMVNVDDVIHHAATAAGIQAPLLLEEGVTEADYLSRKISVLNTPFYVRPVEPTPPSGWEALGIPLWVVIAAGAGLLLFAIILTIVLLVRRNKRRKQEEEQKAVEELLATAMPDQVQLGSDGQPVEQPVELDENGDPVSGADVMDLHTERSMELRQSIRDFVDENMEVAALLIKSWLKEDGDNG